MGFRWSWVRIPPSRPIFKGPVFRKGNRAFCVRPYIPWHESLRRTFGSEVVCPHCSGSLRLIALVKTERTIQAMMRMRRIGRTNTLFVLCPWCKIGKQDFGPPITGCAAFGIWVKPDIARYAKSLFAAFFPKAFPRAMRLCVRVACRWKDTAYCGFS